MNRPAGKGDDDERCEKDLVRPGMAARPGTAGAAAAKERQFNRLSAEGWQLEGTGWLSFRYRRGAPNEYRYRVQYLYESRDGQKDDYVRGSRELRFFMRFLQDKHERMSGRERQKRVAFSGEKTIINYQCATSVVHSA